MHLTFLNPQGNFDPQDSYWTEHPDFGGQLVYVKQLALAIASLGHKVDILTRQIIDPEWPEFAGKLDGYPDAPGVRILRLPAGLPEFLRKEDLWPYIIRDWVPNILGFYQQEATFPDALTSHYADGGLSAVLIQEHTGIPFTFTAHSLGAQKMDKMGVTRQNLAEIDKRLHFSRRILAERLSMNHSAVNITSTRQERFEQYHHPAYQGAVQVADDQRFEVIPPGVDLSIFSTVANFPQEASLQARIEGYLSQDLPPERQSLPAILASSRLDPKKNHLGLIQAYASSPSLQEAANLILITGALEDPLHHPEGTSPAERQLIDQIRQQVESANLWGKVSAFGLQGQPALAAAYRYLVKRRSVFALTSLYEPFGLAPLEAMACGLPVVVTQNGGPSESLQDSSQEFGVLVDPSNPVSIARGLERLILNPETWRSFSERGRQRVIDHYTWERTAAGYLSAIQRLLAKSEVPPSRDLLPIPSYFLDPKPEKDIPLTELERLYWG